MKRFFCSLRDTCEELQNVRALSGGVVLEMRDVSEPLIPDSLADELRRQFVPFEEPGTDAHDEDFLVVRAVEDADAAALGQLSDVAPHEVVVELLGRGLLERDPLGSPAD